MGYGSLDKRKVRGLVSCCGQDGYRAQVLQHPIVSYVQIHDCSEYFHNIWLATNTIYTNK